MIRITEGANEFERVVAIKDSSGDLPFMRAMMKAVRPGRPDFAFMTGWDSQLVPMLLAGCDGGTNATSGIAPELTRLLFDRVRAHELDEANAVQRRVERLFDALFGAADFPEGFRMGLSLRGIETGAGRMPRSPAQLDDDTRVRADLAELLRGEGLLDRA